MDLVYYANGANYSAPIRFIHNQELNAAHLGTNVITDGHIQLAHDGWLKGLDHAGTAEKNIIRSTGAAGSEVTELPAGTILSSSTQTDVPAAVACVKYVDDEITTALTSGFTPSTAGGSDVSLTLPTGHIIKFCSAIYVSGTGDWRVTFGTAFPTDCLSAVVTPLGAVSNGYAPTISSKAADALVIEWNGTTTFTMEVIAIGY
jgi:hypothetical protein